MAACRQPDRRGARRLTRTATAAARSSLSSSPDRSGGMDRAGRSGGPLRREAGIWSGILRSSGSEAAGREGMNWRVMAGGPIPVGLRRRVAIRP
ncbi:MAG: hypothetical protein WCY97_08155 [Methanothrix sp.]|nr:hypothetical protein [Methanothrix harundinacea]MDD3710493.1 hypothetical protein [Methanothrix sp.]MDI9398383.1 hypothetical protein [Euryarchaeota archaeon]